MAYLLSSDHWRSTVITSLNQTTSLLTLLQKTVSTFILSLSQQIELEKCISGPCQPHRTRLPLQGKRSYMVALRKPRSVQSVFHHRHPWEGLVGLREKAFGGMHLYRYLLRSQENDLDCLGEILAAFEFHYVLYSAQPSLDTFSS